MQARECSFRLANGRTCHAAATRNQPFCRHHGPKPAVAGPPPLSRRDRYSRLARWADLGRRVPWLDPSQVPSEAYSILESLLEDGTTGISDREAGRLLRGLLRRLGSVPFPLPGEPGVSGDPADPQLLSQMLAALGQQGLGRP